jgi:hypothetical protein
MTNTAEKADAKSPSGGNFWFNRPKVVCVSLFLLKRGEGYREPDSAFPGRNQPLNAPVWWAILLIIASFISWLYVPGACPSPSLIPVANSRCSGAVGC